MVLILAWWPIFSLVLYYFLKFELLNPWLKQSLAAAVALGHGVVITNPPVIPNSSLPEFWNSGKMQQDQYSYLRQFDISNQSEKMDCQLNYFLGQNTTLLLAASHATIRTIKFYATKQSVNYNFPIMRSPFCMTWDSLAHQNNQVCKWKKKPQATVRRSLELWQGCISTCSIS